MSKVPDNLKFTKDHEWILVDDNGIRNIENWDLLLDSSNPPSGWEYDNLLIIPESALGKYLTIVVSWEDMNENMTSFRHMENIMEILLVIVQGRNFGQHLDYAHKLKFLFWFPLIQPTAR